MFKKLLLVMFVLTLALGLCGLAIAAKGPNEAKRIPVNIPGAGRTVLTNSVTSIAPVFTQVANLSGVVRPGGLNRTPSATCTDEYYDNCYPGYYWPIAAIRGGAVRFTVNAAQACSLKRVDLYMVPAGQVGTGGITVFVSGDDGFGFPGAVLYSVSVPHASIINLPGVTSIPLPASLVLVGPVDYHVGYQMNLPGDQYNLLTDDGSCGAGRSSVLYNLPPNTWFPWTALVSPPDNDFNWAISVNTCCFTPGPPGICGSQGYDCGPAFITSYKAPWAVRMTAAGECTLKTIKVAVHANAQTGTGGITAYVYSDAAGFPGTLLASVPVAHGSISYFPTLTTVNFSSFGLVFNSVDYHIGYQITNPGTDQYKPVFDNGTCGAGRSSFFDVGFTNVWTAMADPINGFGTDYNFLFYDSTCCAAPPASLCFNINYAGSLAYYWTEPDIYGDQFRNMRFTNVDFCTLKTVNLYFYGPGTVGTPGATVYIWNSDGTFPTSVITSYVVNPVTTFYPGATSVNVAPANIALSGDYHVGYSTILNAPTDVLAILSDDGSTMEGRSSEFYSGAWYTMLSGWGVDVSFLINVDVCCTPPGYCPIICSPTDQWPMFGHDGARTGQTQLTMGDLCGIVRTWIYDSPKAIGLSAAPLIYNDVVYICLDDRVVALNLFTNATIWDTEVTPGLIPQYSTVNPASGMRAMMTIDGTGIYWVTASLRGIVKANLATGDTLWARGTAVGNPLPGTTGNNFSGGSIVSGNEIYFGDEVGQIYALNKTTGVNLYFKQLYADNGVVNKGRIEGPITTDGSALFIAMSGSSRGTATSIGCMVSEQPGGAFTQNWKYISPNQATLHESWSAGSTFRCDQLFAQTYFGFGFSGNFAGYRQSFDPATGTTNWPIAPAEGQALFAPPSTDNERVYFHSINNGFNSPNGNTRGVRAVNFLNSTVWVRGDNGSYGDLFVDNNVWTQPVVTCDPYVIYGGSDGSTAFGPHRLFFVDGPTGAELLYYELSGRITGIAVASGSDGYIYVVTSLQYRNNSSANPGRLVTLKLGDPRPRMAIPEALVVLPGTNTTELAPVQRTDLDAVENVGCLTLNATATLEAGNPPLGRRSISNVHPELKRRADQLANGLVDYRLEETIGQRVSPSIVKGFSAMAIDAEAEPTAIQTPVKSLPASSTRLAPPTWVDWVTPFSGGATVAFSVAPGGSQNFTFEFDRSGMLFLAPNNFYVEIDSDDPDFFVEQLVQPSPQAVIEYQIAYEYCPQQEEFVEFGVAGEAWATNYGMLAEGDVTFEFSLDSSSDGAYSYSGTMFFMSSMNNAAWNVRTSTYTTNYLYPFYVGPFANQDCGGCQFGINLPVDYTTDGGGTYSNPVGDLCTFAMIDSLQGILEPTHQSGPSIGLLVNYRIIGTYGADFDGFVLYVLDINNRNAAPITGLYYGNLEDWDIGSDNGFGDPAGGYVYQDDGDIRGFIGFPQEGSYWPDGTKTDPMYNATVIENGYWIYPSATRPEGIVDSLYQIVNSIPEGGFVLMPPGTTGDRSTIATFGKADIGAFGSKSYGFAIYGINGSADFNGDTEAMAAFINKYAGFARGDVNDDGLIDLRDLVKLSRYVASLGPGPAPFKHLGDVDNDGDVDADDCSYLAAYYFSGGAPPKSDFVF